MSTTFITPATLAQAEWHLEASGITDLVCPPRPPGQRGRIGMTRNNTYLLLLAWVLCTMLGLETTLQKAHDVLTTNLTRQDQWRLGVLRKAVTTRPSREEPDSPDWYTKKLNKRGKRQKITWNGFEQVGYDDLVNAVRHFRDLFDYGAGTAPDLDPSPQRKLRPRSERHRAATCRQAAHRRFRLEAVSDMSGADLALGGCNCPPGFVQMRGRTSHYAKSANTPRLAMKSQPVSP